MKQILRIAGVDRAVVVPSFFGMVNHSMALLVLGLFTVFVLSVPKFDLTAIVAFASFPVVFSIASRLPGMLILKRLALLSPFILIMAAANSFIDRRPVFDIYGLTVTAGMVSGMVIVGKSLVTITAVISFTCCVPFYRLCGALRSLGIPEVFTTQLVLLYRYSFLLVEEAMAMQKARNMRSFGKKGKGPIATAKLIGALLLRTTNRADRIYRGMVSRGFNGELVKTKHKKMAYGDWAVVGVSFVLFGMIRIVF